jgi:hypothetical protein
MQILNGLKLELSCCARWYWLRSRHHELTTNNNSDYDGYPGAVGASALNWAAVDCSSPSLKLASLPSYCLLVETGYL